VREALRRHAGLDLAALQARDDLARALAERGRPAAAGDSWDELFHRAWIADVEPRLGHGRPLFVHDYPASQAALARTRREPWGDVAERFELYLAGVEIANAFDELNDPLEQRRRHEADRDARRAAGRPVPPLDERFLAALESGMPPASGIALGLDRLAALLIGVSSLDEISAFP
jgi:lysyl-tRNA synthetase class 2